VTNGPSPVAAVFASLADETRRDVLDVVLRHGRVSASAIAREVPISRQGITKHLAVLSEAGLVSSERVGREVLYAVRPEPLQAAARWLDRSAAAWDRRLAALKASAERAP
jgi:DNA-binding transcriptional ArsR family regulator